MKARALFSAGLLCAKQGKPEVQWKGRTGDRQVTAAYRIFRRNVCYDVPFWVLSVSGGSTQCFIASFAFGTWVMAQVLSHTKPTCLRSHLSKRWCVSLLCWHAPDTTARGQDPEQRQCLALLGCLQLTVPFSHSGSSTFLLIRKKTGEEELSYCRAWEIKEDFSVSLWFFAKEM